MEKNSRVMLRVRITDERQRRGRRRNVLFGKRWNFYEMRFNGSPWASMMASSPSEEKKIARAAAYNQMMDHFPIHSQEWASEWEKAISVYEVVEGAHNSNADLYVDAEYIAANSLEDAEMDWIDIMNCIYFFLLFFSAEK